MSLRDAIQTSSVAIGSHTQQAKQIQFFDVWFTHCLLLFFVQF